MKILSLLPAAVLVLSLAACSTGSSNDPEPETSTNTEPAETNQVVDEVAQADDPTGDADTATQPAMPVINPDSSLGQLIGRVQLLAGSALLDLNQSLNQGELLSEQENECVGAYDPALGEPLLNIDCAQPLAVNEVPLYLSKASLADSSACRAGLQNNSANDCTVVSANLTISTLWYIPPTAEGQPERPRPKAGALVNYDSEQGRLSFENLEAATSGVFQCEYDLNLNLELFGATDVIWQCGQQLELLVLLIDEHLASNQ